MDDKTLYAKLLGLSPPWGVERVELKLAEGEVHLFVALPPRELWVCPECLERAPIHDHRERVWRHLDTFQYRTLLHARVPRLRCPNHGVKQIRVPWAEDRSRFTALFEALAIDWLRTAPISVVAQRLHLSWDEAAGIQGRAVARGLDRREPEDLEAIGVDETSFQRRHEYVTVVGKLGDRPKVIYVADERKAHSLDGFWLELSAEQKAGIRAVAMDMCEPYLSSTMNHLPEASRKIVYDRFHVAARINKAVEEVRKAENRRLRQRGDTTLVGTKYHWLRHPDSFTEEAWAEFAALRESNLQTARAWVFKETFLDLYGCESVEEADTFFKQWFGWARRSRIEPIKKVALTMKFRWPNIRTWFAHKISNGTLEALNAGIQWVKYMSRGFRNRLRFRNAIYFHLGGLDLYPACLGGHTHS